MRYHTGPDLSTSAYNCRDWLRGLRIGFADGGGVVVLKGKAVKGEGSRWRVGRRGIERRGIERRGEGRGA